VGEFLVEWRRGRDLWGREEICQGRKRLRRLQLGQDHFKGFGAFLSQDLEFL
jgi:hypothetical protein